MQAVLKLTDYFTRKPIYLDVVNIQAVRHRDKDAGYDESSIYLYSREQPFTVIETPARVVDSIMLFYKKPGEVEVAKMQKQETPPDAH
jgi:hypothetical protein